jgi:ParB family chromosome partitioning protein
MASKGNRGFADLIAGGAGGSTARLPPRTGILAARENRLASLAAGQAMTRVHELVDPARCRVWAGHNRDYGALNETACADLIDSLKAQGRQEVPAIVRRITSDPEHEFEVICGARRHWSITWLRAHDHPEFRFLVEPRELSDEEAFRVADLENRSRKDLSDYERAIDYARAVAAYYGGSQQRMAERLQVTRSWLSRYLELAKLPAPVLAAFGTPHALGISHAAKLAPALRSPAGQKRVLAAAEALAAEQQGRAGEGKPFIGPGEVTRRLAAPSRTPKWTTNRAEARDSAGRVIAQAERGRGGRITITIPKPDAVDGGELLKGVMALLEQLSP